MSMSRNVLAAPVALEGRESFAEPVVEQNLRDRRPDLSEDVVGLVSEFLSTIKDGVHRRTAETVGPCNPLVRMSRVRSRQAQLDATKPLPAEEVGVIALSGEVGREAVARGLRALLVRLESRRGPQSLPRKVR